MSTNIRTTISFSIYKAVIDSVMQNVFDDEVFHAENVAISKRVAVLQAFAPDFVIPNDENTDNDAIAEAVYSEEAETILERLADNKQYRELSMAIDKAIDHRLKMVENGAMSLTDYALSQLVKTLDEKIAGYDLTADGIKAVTDAVNRSDETDFAGNLVDAFVEKGMIAKPPRATRRANGQRSTAKRTKKEPIKLDVEQTKD